MKAILLTGFGGTDMLRYGDAPDPVASSGDLVVDVYAASVNAADSKVRRGAYGDLPFPHILGRDFSGVVSAVGAGVDDLTVGDAVFGVTERGVEGAYAEKLAIKAAIVAKKPEQLSHVEAAAMGLISLTALWALEDTAQLTPGETILIHGGAGGVAGFAIQLAKWLGATVTTTASPRGEALVRDMGADQIIDYTKTDLAQDGRDCDAAFDLAGGDALNACFTRVKAGGTVLSVAGMPRPSCM